MFWKKFGTGGQIQPNNKNDQSDSITFDCDNKSLKTKLILNSEINDLRFDEKSSFCNVLGFSPYWDYKSFDENFSVKIVNLRSTNKIDFKVDVIVGSLVNGKQEPMLFSFVLDKKSGFKVFCDPETVQYKKIQKSVLKTIPLYLEDVNIEEVIFNGETLTFTIKKIKTWIFKWNFQNLKLFLFALAVDITVLQQTLLVILKLIKKLVKRLK